MFRLIRLLISIGITCLIAALSLYAVVSYSVRSQIVSEMPGDTVRVAVVLGTTPYVARGVANPYFEARMDTAAELYEAGAVDHILVTGDNQTLYYNEPIAMRDALMEREVPEDSIVLDYGGRRTLDSVLRTKEVFAVDAPVFVSQRFHLERALAIARWHNIDAIGYAAPDPSDRSVRARLYAREVLARVRMAYDLFTGVRAEVDASFEPISTTDEK